MDRTVSLFHFALHFWMSIHRCSCSIYAFLLFELLLIFLFMSAAPCSQLLSICFLLSSNLIVKFLSCLFSACWSAALTLAFCREAISDFFFFRQQDVFAFKRNNHFSQLFNFNTSFMTFFNDYRQLFFVRYLINILFEIFYVNV